MTPEDFVAALRAAAPYAHAHHGRVFVIAFGGEAAERPGFDTFVYDMALLHSLGVKLVLVHGARPQINARLATAGLTPHYEGDLRVTDRAALECVKSAVGSLRMAIEARLSTGLASTPMGGARLQVLGGNLITARPVGVRNGIDHHFTGEVRRVDVETLSALLADDRIVLLSPIGYSPTGEVFNLRAEDVATATAIALQADKLLFVLPSDPTPWRAARQTGDAGQLSHAEAEQLIGTTDTISATDRHTVEAALRASRAGVRRVHLIGQERDGGLLRELYTRDGEGVMLHAESDYETLREATIDDVGGILSLIQPLEHSGVLVPRSREQLELEITHFRVIVRDGLVIACCALFPDAGSGHGEFACVAVHPDYRRAGRAHTLLKKVELDARAKGLTHLFSLTTHSPHWFIEHGFTSGSVEALPMARAALYNYQRNSKVLIKAL
jgi:amino-acid N-acetyltransferase